MTTSELYGLLYIVLEAADRVFESWLSASFAIVVANFIDVERLTKRMYQLVAVAYALVSFNMAYRYIISMERFLAIRADITALGEWYEVSSSAPAALGQFAIFVVGVSGTLYFVWQTHETSSRNL